MRNCISDWMNQSNLTDQNRGNRLKDLQEIENAEAARGRLYAAIEAGTIDTDDTILRDRVAGLKLKRDEATRFGRPRRIGRLNQFGQGRPVRRFGSCNPAP